MSNQFDSAALSSLLLTDERDSQEARTQALQDARAALRNMVVIPSVEDISSDNTADDLGNLFKFLYRSEIILLNSIMTLTRFRNKNSILQKGVYKAFFICKALFQIKKYGSVRPFVIEDREDIQREFAIQKTALDLNEAFALTCKNDAERIALLREIFNAAGLSKLVISISGNYKLPVIEESIKPTEYWQGKSAKNRETPAVFILRVYQSYFDKNLTWGAIRKVDPKLYYAYAQWNLRNPNDPFGAQVNKYVLNRSSASHLKLAAKLQEQNVTLGWQSPSDEVEP
ncbi:hypothetical protein J2Y55_004612 [Bosea sp. BE125]|uniref:hypothetical protein n=1 Tax=Bosea sp. BE125 TaxID=2817909 RepID=UPI0028601977|nr:hypothetical protein [Bosea sp. BE125]MDR6873585.1 hypothetical protein [Bosea sp. BE125]